MKYETAIRAGNFVVAVHGTPEEVERARLILGAKGRPDVVTYPCATR